MSSKEGKLSLVWSMPGAARGKDCDPANPLARALRATLKYGKPQKGLLQCFFQDPGTGVGLRWLGVFSETNKGAISFFPGLETLPTWLRVFGANSPKPLDIELDHFTLLPGDDRWHMTDSAGTNRALPAWTYDLAEGRRFWFGMTIARPGMLRLVREQTVVDSEVPMSDSDRRAQTIMDARDGVTFPVVHLPSNDDIQGPYAIHFDVIAGPCGFPPYTGERLGGILSERSEFPLQVYRAKLSTAVDLEIAAWREPGQLQGDVFLKAWNAMGIRIKSTRQGT